MEARLKTLYMWRDAEARMRDDGVNNVQHKRALIKRAIDESQFKLPPGLRHQAYKESLVLLVSRDQRVGVIQNQKQAQKAQQAVESGGTGKNIWSLIGGKRTEWDEGSPWLTA